MKINGYEFNIIRKIIIFCLFINIIIYNIYKKRNIINKGKRVGIIAYYNDNNIGNQLLKYSMHTVLKRFGFIPTLISKSIGNKVNTNFLQKHLNIKEIKNYYTDIKENEFDFLIVNSDQVWAYNFLGILEIGFLSFAKNWNITKLVYAASLGYDFWTSSQKIINSARELVKQFSGVSLREYNSIEIIKTYLGIKPIFVLDPTFLLDKNDYLEIIKNFSMDFDTKKNYLCSYILDKSKIKQDYIYNASMKLKNEIISMNLSSDNFIEKFIFSINLCDSIITDSYHGTIFSIIFNKPFITFINTERGNTRFFSLNQTFHLKNRLIYPKDFEKNDLELLMKRPNIDRVNFKLLKERSIKFLKDNLRMK